MFAENQRQNEQKTTAEQDKKTICFEDGFITLGDVELPGLIVSISISGDVKFDEAKTDGQSGKKKTPMGYEDSVINVDLDLLTDDNSDCYEKLTELNKIFKGVGPKAAPKILTVVNRHMRARGIDQVVFSGLSSKEDNQSDWIMAALTFSEHLPPITISENRVVGKELKAQQTAADKAKQAAPPANPAPDTESFDLSK